MTYKVMELESGGTVLRPATREEWEAKHPDYRLPRHDLDDTDSDILDRRQAGLDRRFTPGVGDVVYYPDGSRRRIAYIWFDEHYQPTDGRYAGSFYLGEDGYVSFSGGLDPGIPIDKLDGINTGHELARCWFFRHDHRRAHNAVDVKASFRVWRSTVPVDWREHDCPIKHTEWVEECLPCSTGTPCDGWFRQKCPRGGTFFGTCETGRRKT